MIMQARCRQLNQHWVACRIPPCACQTVFFKLSAVMPYEEAATTAFFVLRPCVATWIPWIGRGDAEEEHQEDVRQEGWGWHSCFCHFWLYMAYLAAMAG